MIGFSGVSLFPGDGSLPPNRTSPSWCDLGQGVDPDLHKRLVGEVRAGISARQMEVDVD